MVANIKIPQSAKVVCVYGDWEMFPFFLHLMPAKVVCVYGDWEMFPFFLHLMPAQDLKDLKRVLLKKIHNLCDDRAILYDQLASVNGELDRRVNMAVCGKCGMLNFE